MRSLLLLLAALALPAQAQQTPLSIVQPARIVTPYCLATAPTVIAGYFVPTEYSSTVSPITVTDGANTYVLTITGNAASCFIKQ